MPEDGKKIDAVDRAPVRAELAQLHARDEDPSQAIKILIALLKEQDLDLPLQYKNFRD